MKNKIFFLSFSIFFIFCSLSLHASIDKNKEFDSIYFHTAVTVAAKDIEVALHIADSLFLNSEGTLNKVKSLMLSSSLFQQKGDLASSIRIAEKAYSLAYRSKIYDWQASFVKLAQLTPENTNNRNQEGEDSKVMPKETEETILEELISFEKGGKYLDKNISLSKLASIVDTNPKYLSHVLNTHKKQNFNTYINTLRIKYIVSKLKNNKQYRNYKISYLAEETGFSSHTKFSQAFKAVTNLSPSVFLKELEKVSI